MKELICRYCFALLVLLFVLPAGAREIRSLDAGWQFIREDVSGAAAADFDDAGWTGVSLPHTWNAQDATGGPQKYHRGPAWYRRTIELSESDAGKLVYLWFGAAGSAAEVFINGTSAGTHKGAFSAFCFDVTPHIKPGKNTVAVRVTNVHDRTIAPLSGDFNIFGGLYRDAKLILTDRIAVSPLDAASPGVYVRQREVSDQLARIEVVTLVRSAEQEARDVEITLTVADDQGTALASATSREPIGPGETRSVVQTVEIPRPRLWNGRIDPYMHTLTVRAGADSVSIPLGLRSFKVDPQQGFLLNGKPYRLYGVSRHQDFADKGWAITRSEMQTDLDLILEMGCTAVRLAHYQQSPEFYAMCDRAGLVVWAELGLVNEIDFSQEFADVTRQQLRELILQNYNYASICFWSLWNELSTRAGNPETPIQLELIRQLNDLSHELDPTRPTTAGSHKPVAFEGNWITDIIAFNRYFGWYSGTPTEWPDQLDRLRAFRLDRAIAISEYGAGASVIQHEEGRLVRPRHNGAWHPEQWQATTHEQAWSAMRTRPWLWATFVWNFADFAAEGRREGDTTGLNDKGLVTYDRKIRKDAFYWYKANWSSEPFVHITSRRFTPRPDERVTFKIYSNCDWVELTVNGQPLGRRTSTERIFQWGNVPLKLGANQIEATGFRDGQRVADACTIERDPAATTQPASLPATR